MSDARVIDVPSVEYGEEVMAWIRLRPDTTLTDDDMKRFCTGKISTFTMPRYWKFVSEFPMTVTGRAQKFRMRELAVQELDLHGATSTETA